MTSGKTYLVQVVGCGDAPVAFEIKETFGHSTFTPSHTSGDDPSILDGDHRKVEIGVTENGTFLVYRKLTVQSLDKDGNKVSTSTRTFTKVADFAGCSAAMDATKPEEAAILFQVKDLPAWTGLDPVEV